MKVLTSWRDRACEIALVAELLANGGPVLVSDAVVDRVADVAVAEDAVLAEDAFTGRANGGDGALRLQVARVGLERDADVEGDKLRGSYLDPRAGRVVLSTYAREWLAAQTFEETSREVIEQRLRLHVFPYLGSHELAAIRPSQVQALLRRLQGELAPNTVRVVLAALSAVLTAAVEDGRIAKNPCRVSSVRARRPDPRKIVPWPREQVRAVRDALPPRYQPTASLAAFLGLRQGEVFALAVEDVDFLRFTVQVRRQVKIVNQRLVFGLPKYRKSRELPLPERLALDLAAHIAAFPPVVVTLPWEAPGGAATSATLLLSTRSGRALNRKNFNKKVWKAALIRSGVAPTRENGMHALRHWFASVLLDSGKHQGGEPVPGSLRCRLTLRTYTHLMPDSERRMRRAMDEAFRQDDQDGPDTAQGPKW